MHVLKLILEKKMLDLITSQWKDTLSQERIFVLVIRSLRKLVHNLYGKSNAKRL